MFICTSSIEYKRSLLILQWQQWPHKQRVISLCCVPEGGGGYSHTLPIRVCATQRGRDFEAPDLERGIHFRGIFERERGIIFQMHESSSFESSHLKLFIYVIVANYEEAFIWCMSRTLLVVIKFCCGDDLHKNSPVHTKHFSTAMCHTTCHLTWTQGVICCFDALQQHVPQCIPIFGL